MAPMQEKPSDKAAAVATQNRRKIEKDRRRKNYHDLQVQGTNNSSIVSKRSVEMLYNPVLEPETHDWFRHFVPKGKRRSPAINRGYWVRMESIRQSVVRIQKHHCACVQVVNLGCGFDPFPFKMLAENPEDYIFFDLDYPNLVQRKVAMIEASPEILAVIGPKMPISDAEKALGVVLSTEKFKLVGCDLKNSALYQQQLQTLVSSAPSIFIAEVSLAYMKPEHANPVVEISARRPNSHVLVLEQIMPAGEQHFFSQKMLHHFDHLRSPLQCVQEYCTKVKQQRRFEEFFPNVEVVDLFQSWNHLVSGRSKELVSQVEDFDEWEEFIIFCQHYVVIHATNSEFELFSAHAPETDNFSVDDLPMARLPGPATKFSASCAGQNGLYTFGGMHQTRTNQMVVIPYAAETPSPNGEKAVLNSAVTLPDSGSPPARMCHTLTPIGKNLLLLVGGRARPGHAMSDVWVFDEQSQIWTQQPDLDTGVSRHCAAPLRENAVLLFHNGQFSRLELGQNLQQHHLVSSQELPPLISAGMAYCPARNVGFLVGGMINDTIPEINSTLYQFSLDQNEVKISAVSESQHFARIGCMAKVQGSSLYILGGAGHQLQNQQTTVMKFDLKKEIFTGMSMPDEIWASGPVFVGSSLAGNSVLGGGAVCYSFGSSYNSGYSIKF